MLKLSAPNRESGFTLVEIVTVILIMGVLAAIAIPVYLNQRKEAWKAAVREDITNWVLVVERDKSLNDGKYPVYASSPPSAKVSPNVSIKVVNLAAVSGETACVEAYSTNEPNPATPADPSKIRDSLFHYNISERKLLPGGC